MMYELELYSTGNNEVNSAFELMYINHRSNVDSNIVYVLVPVHGMEVYVSLGIRF